MGSALNDTHQQLGIAFGVTVLGSLLAAAYRTGLTAAGCALIGAAIAGTVLRRD